MLNVSSLKQFVFNKGKLRYAECFLIHAHQSICRLAYYGKGGQS
jgi:hypothetical protein